MIPESILAWKNDEFYLDFEFILWFFDTVGYTVGSAKKKKCIFFL